ncbi:uncharacterized protein NP_1764A [Natronomonas pharaonis DSM 2160]|uniref:LWR-salt protein n=1 Tax=Natronomonas pharaonis (strain ATCC 35678 / DSM 2160 / CIP 103997 / JCM 8858 / NBRC 14720 / NCIMB 2260 / Gabara) TaxID=348780 RepID=A0A1U7EVC2_NATPD|nr:LWR-salt protein [Natronomonas pharaonis]CAI48973.1 uncharacterized protein NP_1764A [Natronomonas pharaonis DSM 2160]
MTATDADAGDAEYIFRAQVRLSPSDPDLRVEPERIETTVYRAAVSPGEDGWLFFRDTLWRGEINDPAYLRASLESALGVDIENIDFRELRTDRDYYEALKAEIGANLELFNADDTAEVQKKYLGSRIHVRDE